MTKFWQIASILTLICSLVAPPQLAPVQAAGCDDVQFIFARGSGENLNGPSATAWRESIREAMQGINLKYSFYELGSQNQGGYQYPAVAVAGSTQGYLNLVGAYVSGGESNSFGASVRQGSGELTTYLNRVHAVCQKTKFVLGGYSQGGMVVSRTLPKLPSELILYAATFGDPKLYLPEGNYRLGLRYKVPDACYGKNLSNYRAHVPNCYAYQGILGGYNPYQSAGYYNKLGAWCNDNDIMCSSGSSLDDHLAYTAKGLYRRAAATIAQRVKAAFPQSTIDPTNFQASADHEVVILYNSTGAAEVLKDVQEKIRVIGQKVLDAGGDLALRSQSDFGAEYGSSSGYMSSTECYAASSSSTFCPHGGRLGLTEFLHKVQNLDGVDGKAWASGVFASALNLLGSFNWRLGATKSLIIFSQGDPTRSAHNGVTAEDVAALSLSIDPVNVYIVTDEANQPNYQELANATNGGVFDYDDNIEELASIILQRPVAELAMPEYQGLVGEEFLFDASSSANASGTDQLHYDWDLDFDNVFELTDQEAIVTHTYDRATEGYIQVRVRDDRGYSSTMSAKVKVRADLPTLATLSATTTPLEQGRVRVEFQTDGEKVLVAVDDAVMGLINPSERDSFVLADLTPAGVEVTLVPYDANGQRGESTRLRVSPLPEASNNHPASTPEIETPPSAQPDRPSHSDELPAPSSPEREPVNSSPSVLPTVPKTPDSGAPRRRGERLTM